MPDELLRHTEPTLTPTRATVPSAVVDCGLYVDGARRPGRPHYADALAEVRRTGEGFVWLGLHEPTDLEFADIALTFDLHPLDVEDAVTARQRPKPGVLCRHDLRHSQDRSSRRSQL